MDEIGFQFAFTIESFSTNERRDDPAYIKYNIRELTVKNGTWTERILSYHECNETDWIKFAPPAKAFEDKFEKIRDDPKRGFFCIDWPDNEPHLIYGT